MIDHILRFPNCYLWTVGWQFAFLTITRIQPNLAFSELAHLIAMDRTTLTRNLKPLENRGPIKIAPGMDRQINLISNTRDGQQMLARAAYMERHAATGG